VTEVTTVLRSSAEDSLSALSAGIGAVVPDKAAGLVGALTAALPTQRGWRVRALPTVRGSDTSAEIGINLELGPLGQVPDSVTTFWKTSEGFAAASDEANRTAAIGALLHCLLEPASMWIAIRLVSRSLRHTPSPTWWALPRGRERRRELAGMQLQLAGQLSLYASRKLEEYDLGFAEQALSDLAEARRLLPDYFRPHSTAAAVRERIGWSHRRDGADEPARRNFAEAVRGYDQATELLRSRPGAAADAARKRIAARRTKCRILSEDPGHLVLAKTEIAQLAQWADPTWIALYNAACSLPLLRRVRRSTSPSASPMNGGLGTSWGDHC
jgi:tetratricopeptide (TPR) repeat protein